MNSRWGSHALAGVNRRVERHHRGAFVVTQKLKKPVRRLSDEVGVGVPLRDQFLRNVNEWDNLVVTRLLIETRQVLERLDEMGAAVFLAFLF